MFGTHTNYFGPTRIPLGRTGEGVLLEEASPKTRGTVQVHSAMRTHPLDVLHSLVPTGERPQLQAECVKGRHVIRATEGHGFTNGIQHASNLHRELRGTNRTQRRCAPGAGGITSTSFPTIAPSDSTGPTLSAAPTTARSSRTTG